MRRGRGRRRIHGRLADRARCEVLVGESAVLTAGQVAGWLRTENGAGRPDASD